MSEQFVDWSLTDVCADLCSSLDDEAFLVNPSSTVIDALAEYGIEHPDRFSSLQMLAEEGSLKQSLSRFTTASRLADLIDQELLEIRYLPNPPKSSMAVDSDQVIVLIDAADRVGTLSTSDGNFVAVVNETIEAKYRDAERYVLHTPAISRVETTLENRMGADRRDTFINLVDAADSNGYQVDEVTISLLVAAKHQDLLYDISKWGEDIGLASKATFSRKKSELEALDVLDTESVPIDVGRPRLRLRFAEPYLEQAKPVEVVEDISSRFK